MLSQWLKEQWYDIKYAHKSLWASLLCLTLGASALVWEYADHRYADDIAKRDDYIHQLETQNVQLRALVAKYVPKQSRNSDESVTDKMNDKIYEIQNDVNNMKSDAQEHYQQMNNTITTTQNGVDNSINNVQNDADTTYRRGKQKAYTTYQSVTR